MSALIIGAVVMAKLHWMSGERGWALAWIALSLVEAASFMAMELR